MMTHHSSRVTSAGHSDNNYVGNVQLIGNSRVFFESRLPTVDIDNCEGSKWDVVRDAEETENIASENKFTLCESLSEEPRRDDVSYDLSPRIHSKQFPGIENTTIQ